MTFYLLYLYTTIQRLDLLIIPLRHTAALVELVVLANFQEQDSRHLLAHLVQLYN